MLADRRAAVPNLVLPEERSVLLGAVSRIDAILSTLDEKLQRPFLPWQMWTLFVLMRMEGEYHEERNRLLAALGADAWGETPTT